MYLASEINLNRLRREIEEIVDVEERTKLEHLILPVVIAAVKLLTDERETVVTEFRRSFLLRTLKETIRNPFTIRGERIWSQIAYVSAAAAMVQDSLVSGSLAQSWLNVAPMTAIIVGAVAGIVLSVGWKFGVGLSSDAYTREQPRRARRKVQTLTAAAFIVNFVLVFLVLSSRNPSESWVEFLANVNSFSLTIMGIALPVLAGALLALAQDLDWSHRDTEDFRRLTMRIAELSGFIAWCEDSRFGESGESMAEDLATEPTV